MAEASGELQVIRVTYDLILWYVPRLNRLPRDHRFTIGERVITGLYELLEGLVSARYLPRERTRLLESLNGRVNLLRYQTRLLKDFGLLDLRRYEFAGRHLVDIGRQIGAWRGQAVRG